MIVLQIGVCIMMRNVPAERVQSTCEDVLMPTMTSTPLLIAQLIATADVLTPRALATSLSVPSNGAQEGSSALKIKPRGPLGSRSTSYLPTMTDEMRFEYEV